MTKGLTWALLAALLLALAGGGWHWWAELRFLERTDNAYVRGDLSIVSPRIAGYVVTVEAEENRPVRRGDVLVRLDPRDAGTRLHHAEAALQARAAAVAVVASELKVQAMRVREAEADLASRRAEAARALGDFERYLRLVQKRNASEQSLDTARAEAERTQAVVAAGEAALAAARDQLPVLRAREAAARAEQAMAKAALDLARLDLDHTVIRAPVDGMVGNKGVEIGDYVKVGQQLMAVVPLDRLYVEASFKETQLEALRPGARVRLEVDAYPRIPLAGTIQSLAPASGSTFSLLPPENATGNFIKIVQRVPVRITLPEPSPLAGLLRPGLSVVVTADRREAGRALAVALDAGR